MAKTKKLTLSTIDKLNNTYENKKQIKILGEYDVLIHEKFRKSLIKNVIMSYFKTIQQLKNTDNLTDETIANTIALLNVFIIREFSDVPIPDVNSIEDLVQVANALLDTGILEEVINAFDKSQLDLISKEMEQASKNIGAILGEIALQQSLDETGEDNNAIIQ